MGYMQGMQNVQQAMTDSKKVQEESMVPGQEKKNELPPVIIQGSHNFVYNPQCNPEVTVNSSFFSTQTVSQAVSQISQQTTTFINTVGGYCSWFGNKVSSGVEVVWQWCKDHKAIVITGAILVLLVLLYATIGSVQSNLRNEPRDTHHNDTNWSLWQSTGSLFTGVGDTATAGVPGVPNTRWDKIHKKASAATKSVGEALLADIQIRHLNRTDPLDLREPFKGFVQDVSTERGRMNTLSRISSVLHMLHASRPFGIDQELVDSLPGRREILADIEKLAFVTARQLETPQSADTHQKLSEIAAIVQQIIPLLKTDAPIKAEPA